MEKHLFLRIVDALGNHPKYFQLTHDTTEKRGMAPLTKCTAAMRMLPCGITANCVNEYLKIGVSTTLECMKKFYLAITQVFGNDTWENKIKPMFISKRNL